MHRNDPILGKLTRAMKTNTKIISSVFLLSTLFLAWLGGMSARGEVPRAAAASTTLYTTLFVQNLDRYNTMNAKLTYYNSNGQPLLSLNKTIEPFRNTIIDQPSQSGLPVDYVGTGVLEADAPLGVIVTEYAGRASTLGRDFRIEGYSGWPSISPGTDIALPQLLKNIYDSGTGMTFNSKIVVQNTSPSSASVTIMYKQSTGAEYVHSGIAIPPGGSYSADLPSDSALSGVSWFYGTGRVTSTQPVAVVVHHNAAGLLQIYSGFSSSYASTTLYLPQLLKNVYDSVSGFTWNTGVPVMSMDGTTANVTITYESGSGSVYSESQTAAPMGGFDLRYSSALAGVGSFYGTGKLTADKPIVATLNQTTTYDPNRGIRGATYRAFPSTAAASRVFLPILRKNVLDAATGIRQSTGIAGRLVGNSQTTVTLTYYFTDGPTLQRTQTVSPSAPVILFDQRYDAGLPDGSVASGVLTTSPAQPIVAVVNVTTDSTVLGDAFMSYEGISQ